MKSLIRYILIAFLLPLVCMLLQKTTVMSDSSAMPVLVMGFILYGIEAASPSIAAIIVICLEKDKLSYYFEIRPTVKTIVVPFITAGLTMFLSRLIWNLCTGMRSMLGAISSKQLIIIAWALIAEEFGWRGFLEPKIYELLGAGNLDDRMSASTDRKIVTGDYYKKKWAATLITGLTWSAWHYHFFILNGMEVPLYLFVIGAVVESFIYSFFMEITNRNIVSAMVYHFSWNLFLHLFMINPSDNGGSSGIYVLMVAIEIVIAIVCMNTWGRS